MSVQEVDETFSDEWVQWGLEPAFPGGLVMSTDKKNIHFVLFTFKLLWSQR